MFNSKDIEAKAIELGLIKPGDRLPNNIRAQVAQQLQEPARVPSGEPLTVRIEISYQGQIVGASTVQIPHPGAATT